VNADVVVIGGGVVGAASAYFLSRRGLAVTLVEKGGISQGTSSRCDGNVLLIDKMPGFDCRLAGLSQELFPRVAAELDDDIEWRRRGSLLVIESEAELTVATDFCRSLQNEGLPVRILDSREVRADEPRLAEGVLGGMEAACDGSVNPMALAWGLIRGAAKHGAVIRSHTVVTGIVKNSDGGVCGVLTDAGKIATPRVVNAAGIWAEEIGRMAGVTVPIQPRQGQILVGERTRPVARRKVMEFGYLMAKFGAGDYQRNVTPEMEAFGIAFVFEPTPAGNFLIGSSRRFVGRDTRCHPPLLAAMAARAISFFPLLRDMRVIRTYAGLRPYTPDHFPIVSETPVPGFYVSAGHEGDGIGLSLISGKLIGQILCGEATDIDVAPLRLDRFAGQPIGRLPVDPLTNGASTC
jgi:glycine/D-amino acid oxidase-like deaminating enzyme